MMPNVTRNEHDALRYLDGAQEPDVNVLRVLSTELGPNGWGRSLTSRGLVRTGWVGGVWGRRLTDAGRTAARTPPTP